jgi:glycosyltransferase involved in cell wall biosynthesis
MHILVIHQAFVSPGEPGGTRHYELARHLVNEGHRVSIVGSDLSYLTGQRTVKRVGLVSEEILDGIRVLRTFTYPALHRNFVWRVISFCTFMLTSLIAALRVDKIDLVMGTSPPIFQAASAWLVSVIYRRPFLLEIRDLWPEFAIDMGVLTNPVLITLSRWLEIFLYRQASHIIVNSPAYQDYLIQRGVLVEKISLISNGVDPKAFDPKLDGDGFRREWNLDEKFIVAYTGALGLANDIPTIIRAADILKDHHRIHFLLVGDGKERNNLEAMARRLHLANITFTGTKPKAEMPKVLAASNACIATLKDIPMFRTTYPNKVFEYMAAGRPTILAIDGVIRKVIEEAGAGIFVQPGNEVALADAIRILSEQNEKAQRMGLVARNYVLKHFNRYKQAQEFSNLVERLGNTARR